MVVVLHFSLALPEHCGRLSELTGDWIGVKGVSTISHFLNALVMLCVVGHPWVRARGFLQRGSGKGRLRLMPTPVLRSM